MREREHRIKALDFRICSSISETWFRGVDSYANWFETNYKIKRPIVIRNFPQKSESPKSFVENSPKIILYQGTINYSRGIDKMIEAMQFIENAEFHIAGRGPFLEEYQQLTRNLHLENKVKFLGNLHPDDLRKITEKADVGLSIEENKGLSYYYSLPNKISDYIQARVPVVVSKFPEMQKIVENYHVGEFITSPLRTSFAITFCPSVNSSFRLLSATHFLINVSCTLHLS